ncbi:MAG: host attachment protein [Myxococcales bacterium]
MATQIEPPRRWVLVADERRARILVERFGRLELLEAFEHCESRDSRLEIMWGTFGNVGPSLAATNAGKLLTTERAEPTTRDAPNSIEHEGFARQLAARLARGLIERAYDRLVVTAPASFLPSLKSALSMDVEGRVEAYVSRDLSKSSEREVKAHIAQEVSSHLP